MRRQSVGNFLFPLFIFIVLLIIAVVTQNEKKIIECPREEAPIEQLRELDKNKLPDKEFELLDDMRSTLKQIFAIYSVDSFLGSPEKRMLDFQIVIWHFLHIVENALRQIKEMELFDGIANKCEKLGEIRTKFEKEWEELTEKWQINEDFKFNVKICLLHGFTHRIIRHETLNGHSEWATYAKSVSNGIFSIEGGPEFDSVKIMPFQVLMDIRCVQFQFHTNSASAIKFENQIIFRHLLGDSKLAEHEKAIRQSAENASELARHILSKVKAVKMEAMGSDAMELAKGICIVSKLAEFVEQQSKVAATEPKKSIGIFWLLILYDRCRIVPLPTLVKTQKVAHIPKMANTFFGDFSFPLALALSFVPLINRCCDEVSKVSMWAKCQRYR
ncbi:hypothetical protein niasHS_011750 [Heterodera schachtii]|uniref:Uncharacterized protein n=1 Tax=Heterodera schachtii TaxID=97005 RepID=A0ABD2I876_HETSC